MPNSPYESISRFSSYQDRYYVQNTIARKTPVQVAPAPKKVKIEGTRLAFIANGGKWVLFALVFPFYFLFYAAPQWLFRKVQKGLHQVQKGLHYLKELAAKWVAAALAPFIRLAKLTRKTGKRIAAAICLPFIRLNQAIKNIREKISRALAKAAAFPAKLKKQLLAPFIKLKKIPGIMAARAAQIKANIKARLLAILLAPLKGVKLVKQKVAFWKKTAASKMQAFAARLQKIGKSINDPIDKTIDKTCKFFAKINRSIKAKISALAALPVSKWRALEKRGAAAVHSVSQKIHTIYEKAANPFRQMGKRLAQIPAKCRHALLNSMLYQTVKTLRVSFSKNLTQVLSRLKFNIRIDLSRFKFEIPGLKTLSRKLSSIKMPKLPPLKMNFKLPLGFIPKGFNRLKSYKLLVMNNLSLLFSYWSEQVKEMISKYGTK